MEPDSSVIGQAEIIKLGIGHTWVEFGSYVLFLKIITYALGSGRIYNEYLNTLFPIVENSLFTRGFRV